MDLYNIVEFYSIHWRKGYKILTGAGESITGVSSNTGTHETARYVRARGKLTASIVVQ